MFTREKLIIRLNLLTRTLLFHFVFWYTSLLLFVFFSGNDRLFSHYIQLESINHWYVTKLILAVSLAVLFALLDSFFNDRLMRSTTHRVWLLIPSAMYLLLGLVLILMGSGSPSDIINNIKSGGITAIIPELNIEFWRFLVFFYLACFFNNFIRRAIKRIGKGNLKNWLFGMMNKPREDERIFMFIDMKSSTTIAEQMSHQKFSHLVQDIFNDLAIIDNYDGEIYQYLGDGAIISWPLKKGLNNLNFLRGYFGFINLIHQREQYYLRKYDVIPTFKAGMHVGKVMVLQVGRIRRDISYNGDTINTTARIESMCNTYSKNLLISGDLIELIGDQRDYMIKEVGNLRLKGKRRKVDVFYVREKHASSSEGPAIMKNLVDKLSVYKNQVVTAD